MFSNFILLLGICKTSDDTPISIPLDTEPKYLILNTLKFGQNFVTTLAVFDQNQNKPGVRRSSTFNIFLKGK